MIKRLIILMTALGIPFTGLSCAPAATVQKDEASMMVAAEEDPLKEHAEGIGRLYGKLKIVSLDKISEENYKEYRKYIDNGRAYIIVHPQYYLFFHDSNGNKLVLERQRGDFSKNIVDLFVEDYPVGENRMLAKMKASAKSERDFLKEKASERLVILVLPSDYLNHPEYPYRRLDEFARYLNEVTGSSPSVIYVESDTHNEGRMNPKVMAKLIKFLYATKVKSLFLGGGYVDLCLSEFKDNLTNVFESVRLIPEICTESPDLTGE